MKFFSAVFIGLTLFSVAYADFSSTSFILENPILTEGGGESSSSSFRYLSTTGQFTQVQSTSLSFGQNAGFLYFPSISEVVTPVDVGGGGGGSAISAPGLIFDDNSCSVADFSCDARVNILDLSILLFWLEKSDVRALRYDLNHDGKVDITDISILFYYWTQD